ncbi:hypothetical protein LINGRAHAP2_LOCUS3498 [Linum grandiflorum]
MGNPTTQFQIHHQPNLHNHLTNPAPPPESPDGDLITQLSSPPFDELHPAGSGREARREGSAAEEGPFGGVRRGIGRRGEAGDGSVDLLQPSSVRGASGGSRAGLRVRSSGPDQYSVRVFEVREGEDAD